MLASTPAAAATATDRSVGFRPAAPEDADGIRQLLRETPFGHPISLTLEPDPDHGGALTCPTTSRAVVATRPAAPRAILGMAERTVQPVWLGGAPARVGYLGGFRKKPGAEITLRRLREGFDLLEEHRLPGEAAFDFTSVLANNTAARRLLERGLPGLPRYEPAGEMSTLTFALTRAARAAPCCDVRQVRHGERGEVLAFAQDRFRGRQLSPVMADGDFELPGTTWFVARRGGQPVGCVALWDQRAFKTVTVHGYVPWLHRLRRPINLARAVTGAPRLPRPGASLPVAFLSFVAADPDDTAALAALIRAAAATVAAADTVEHPLKLLSLGLPADHPAVPNLRKSLRPEVTSSIIYLVHPPRHHHHVQHAEGAPLAGGLPIHPEIAFM